MTILFKLIDRVFCTLNQTRSAGIPVSLLAVRRSGEHVGDRDTNRDDDDADLVGEKRRRRDERQRRETGRKIEEREKERRSSPDGFSAQKTCCFGSHEWPRPSRTPSPAAQKARLAAAKFAKPCVPGLARRGRWASVNIERCRSRIRGKLACVRAGRDVDAAFTRSLG